MCIYISVQRPRFRPTKWFQRMRWMEHSGNPFLDVAPCCTMLGRRGGGCPKLSTFLMSSTMFIIRVFWSLNVTLRKKHARFGVVASTFWRLEIVLIWSQHVTFMSDHHHGHHLLNFHFFKIDVENNLYRTSRFFFVVNFPRLEWSKWYPDRPCMDSCCLWQRLCIWQSRTSRFQVPNFRE